MRYETLGQTGLTVSIVSFGTSPLGDMFGPIDERTALATVGHAIDAGITFFDSAAYYGDGLAERRLGAALRGHRDEVIIGTKAGRYGRDEFDYSPGRLRRSLERSLRLLRTDHVDIFQLHDIEFADLDRLFDESYPTLASLKEEGKCRFIGMSGYPLHTMRRAVAETQLDVVLSYAHHTLLNTRLEPDLLPLCRARGTAVINAAAVALGLLTPSGPRIDHLAGPKIRAAARRAVHACERRGADIGFLANQFSIQRSGCPTTVIGTTNPDHLASAVAAATTPIDEDLLAAVLAETADVHDEPWISGRARNNTPVAGSRDPAPAPGG